MKRKIFILLALVIMALIFRFSMQNSSESSGISTKLTEWVLNRFVRNYGDMSAEEKKNLLKTAEHIIRKLAHFSVYTVLGFCMSSAIGKRKFFTGGSLITVSVGFAYACSDELHQFFVSGRSCRFSDVIIDTGGVVTGIIVSVALFRILDRFKQKFTHSPS